MATYESRRYNVPVTDASKIADGSVNNTEFQHLDGVTSDIQGQVDSKLNLSGGTITGDTTLTDNQALRIGTGLDLRLSHDGSNSTIQNTTGTLKVLADTLQFKNNADNETLATFTNGGANNLRFNNGTKLETTSTGVSVTGELGATGNITAGANVNGNGQNLTNLNASNLASGTVADARISTLTASKLTGALPAIDGSNLTGIDVAPSTATSVGALKYFALYYKGSGNNPNTSIGAGTEVVPSTYDSNGKYLSSSVEYNNSASSSGPQDVSRLGYLVPGFAVAGGTLSGKSRASESGTWRCISSPVYNSFTTAGNSGGTYTISGGGLFQRIS